jgi:ketosteroid isomerase-like protein
MNDIAEIIIEVIRAIERRDPEPFGRLCHPDVTFHWPPSLPYGAPATGLQDELGGSSAANGRPTWLETWSPLQPTSAERAMDPRVIGTRGNEVVVLWRQRGIDAAGRRLDEEVLGLYQIADNKLARGQMFYFDTAPVAAFLAAAGRHAPTSNR